MTELSCEKLSCESSLFCKEPLFCEKCLKEFTFASNLRKHYLRCSEPEIRKERLYSWEVFCLKNDKLCSLHTHYFIGDKKILFIRFKYDEEKKNNIYTITIRHNWKLIFEKHFEYDEMRNFLHKKFDI